MAIDPATAKLLAQAALKLASDEEARKRLLMIILTPLLCVVLILTAFVYILIHPLEFLGEFFDSRAITEVERLQNDYGMYQYLAATDYESGVTSYEGVIFTDGGTPVVYYNQGAERYIDMPYGTDNIGGYGCGPTAMAMVVSSLTGKTVDPVEILVADPASKKRSEQEWDLSIFIVAINFRRILGKPRRRNMQ